MRTALLLMLLPTLAAAQDATRFEWGVPVEGSAPSVLSLEHCDLPCVAVVRFDNTLVTSGRRSGIGFPLPMRTTLAIAGVVMAVTVENGTGMVPDLMQVSPPPGYAAEPRKVLVADNTSGRVRVVLVPMS